MNMITLVARAITGDVNDVPYDDLPEQASYLERKTHVHRAILDRIEARAKARAAIEAMAADVSVEETRRAAGQWAFRLAYTSKPQPLNEFEAGYRMGAKREGASLLEADAARAALEGERDGG